METPKRTHWYAVDLETPERGSLWSALLRYRRRLSRYLVPGEYVPGHANLVSSRTQVKGVHLPIIDLDIPHGYLGSTTPGRAHLYLNQPISYPRWVLLLCGLRLGRVIDKGFFWWSLRRGGNFVRVPGVVKLTSTKRVK